MLVYVNECPAIDELLRAEDFPDVMLQESDVAQRDYNMINIMVAIRLVVFTERNGRILAIIFRHGQDINFVCPSVYADAPGHTFSRTMLAECK